MISFSFRLVHLLAAAAAASHPYSIMRRLGRFPTIVHLSQGWGSLTGAFEQSIYVYTRNNKKTMYGPSRDNPGTFVALVLSGQTVSIDQNVQSEGGGGGGVIRRD